MLWLQGMVDTEGFKKIDDAAQITKNEVDCGNWVRATREWANTQQVVLEQTYNVDFYNILLKKSPPRGKGKAGMQVRMTSFAWRTTKFGFYF